MHPEKTCPMRRKDRQIPEEEAWQIVENGQVGVLSMTGPGGEAYAVPLSYAMVEGRLYFHCAKAGRKLDYLLAHPQVCFVVVGPNRPVYIRDFTTLYECAILEGDALVVEDPAEKKQALVALCEKYLPAHLDKAEGDIQRSSPVTLVVRIHVQRISGKAKRQEILGNFE